VPPYRGILGWSVPTDPAVHTVTRYTLVQKRRKTLKQDRGFDPPLPHILVLYFVCLYSLAICEIHILLNNSSGVIDEYRSLFWRTIEHW